MKDDIVIFWFRRDLRLEDNKGLFEALNSGTIVLPVFIFDNDILKKLSHDDSRITFIYEQLTAINNKLKKFDSGVLVKKGNPLAVFKELVQTYQVEHVFTNHDYEPYAKYRDELVKEFLESKKITFKSYKDQVIFEKDDIVKTNGDPYTVYTPYAKKWMTNLKPECYTSYNSEVLLNHCLKEQTVLPSLDELGFQESSIKVKPFDLSLTMLNTYKDNRNYPAIDKGTSKLSPHLRFGTISVRSCVQKAMSSSDITFLKELIWREFFMQILWHFPESENENFKSKYNFIQWRNNEDEFLAWTQGKTGYPLVDAGMRELNATGYMHNRVRMVVASFLCKHLLIHWKWGETYFASKLLDYDLAQNVGNWQWSAGTGCDAAPYFRIFNPHEQLKKFDPNLHYVNKWVPDFQELTYYPQIINHKEARERCLKVYKEGLNNFV